MRIDAQKDGFSANTLDCLGYALTSMETAFPFDFGKASVDNEDRGRFGIISNFLDGVSLNKGLKLGLSLSPRDAKRIISRFLCEVAVIHAVGIVHMDITPPNIILNTPAADAYVVDWDLAQISGSDLLSVSIVYPYEQSVPLPPGFDPNAKKAPSTFFDVWYLPVDILDMIASFDQDMRELFRGTRPYPLFFIKFPTLDKLIELRAYLKHRKAPKTWPPDFDIVRDFKYFDENIKEGHLERFREIVSRYLDSELFTRVYIDALDDKKRPGAVNLQSYLL
jgi:serine/threonine protein kinase